MMKILSGMKRMRKSAILAKFIVVALVFALMWVVMPAGVAAGKTYKGVDFPLGDRSFADQVVKFSPGTDTVSPHNNPQTAIGPPDYRDSKTYVALGHEGILTVRFTDNYLIDVDGADLYVFEIGAAVEPFKVEISKDGSKWIYLDTVRGQPTSLDIHDKVDPGDKFSYVRITDANSGMSGHPYAGADIDAVGAIGAEEKEVEEPDKTSCKDVVWGVDVDPKDFDLAYDNKMLRKEFLNFLKDYGSKHKLKSASNKYAGWDPWDFGELGTFMFDNKPGWDQGKFMTGKEDSLGAAIFAESNKIGRPLNPAEIFELSLKINGDYVFDALLTCHNYLKQRCYEARDRDWAAQQLFNTRLKQLRSKTDNEGAWYHLFGTLTTGYAERENTWKWVGSSAYTRVEVWGEHRFYKSIIEKIRNWEWPAPLDLVDPVEYCWDVWGGYLGGEIYSTLWDNQEKVKEKIKKNPELWKGSVWEKKPGYIKNAYTGQKIYE